MPETAAGLSRKIKKSQKINKSLCKKNDYLPTLIILTVAERDLEI
jgi:hypothetical protein